MTDEELLNDYKKGVDLDFLYYKYLTFLLSRYEKESIVQIKALANKRQEYHKQREFIREKKKKNKKYKFDGEKVVVGKLPKGNKKPTIRNAEFYVCTLILKNWSWLSGHSERVMP